LKRYSTAESKFPSWDAPPLLHYPSFFGRLLPNGCFPYHDASLVLPHQYGDIQSQSRSYYAPVNHGSEKNEDPQEIMRTQEVPISPSQNLISVHNLCIFWNNYNLASTPVPKDALNFRSKSKVILFENNYKHRNVYKSIIRRMSSCIQEANSEMKDLLRKAGFSNEDIEHAFVKVIGCKDTERKSGNKKMGPRLINDASSSVTTYTYILREALKSMLRDWEDDKLGKVVKKNIETYKKVCGAYYEKIEKLLGRE
jgi:hypothetical protein